MLWATTRYSGVVWLIARTNTADVTLHNQTHEEPLEDSTAFLLKVRDSHYALKNPSGTVRGPSEL